MKPWPDSWCLPTCTPHKRRPPSPDAHAYSDVMGREKEPLQGALRSAEVFLQEGAVLDGGLLVERTAGVCQFEEE